MASVKTNRVVQAARKQIGDVYRADYVSIAYPNGDVPRGTGACTDVVVRALRAINVDLQRLVHDDMRANFGAYPRRWGLRSTDKNIDHRRVPNLQMFWKRKGAKLAGVAFAPGDIVTWELPNGRDHCGIVTDAKGPSGNLAVVHNLGRCMEEDCLRVWKITGHYRFPKDL